jgi:hypothetical protein
MTNPPTPSSKPPGYRQCRFSAFFSYSHADSDGWNDWVTSFGQELMMGLKSRLIGADVHPLHVSGDHSLQGGVLGETLVASLSDSFVMVLFVHDGYRESTWCWHELKAFKETFGEEGFRQRLYIVVMSEPAWQELNTREHWQQLFPFKDQRWLPFYRHDNAERPLRIFSEDPLNQSRKTRVSPAFWEPFVDFREELVGKIKQSVAAERVRAYPEARSGPPSEPESTDVLLFIETPRGLERRAEAIGEEVSSRWTEFVEQMALRPPLLLRPTGLPMEDLRLRPRLANADGVILLWASKTPATLAVEIQKLEPSLEGPDVAPGLIAYPIIDGEPPAIAGKLNGWAVVRFTYDAQGKARPLDDDDAGRLENFVSKVIRRKRRRLSGSGPAADAAPSGGA